MQENLEVKLSKSKKSGQLTIVWRRLRRNKIAMIGATIVLLFIFMGISAPLIAPEDPIKIDLERSLEKPGKGGFLGRDELGRDILSRIIYGARISLTIGVVVVGMALIIGVSLGTLAGYCGGLIDDVIMRIMDVMLAFPSILLAIAIISALGPGLYNVMLAVGITSIPPFARLIRGSILSVKENEYVEAAKATGESDMGIIFRYILPNCMAPIIIQSTLKMATVILTASGLSFLGLGVQPPTPEWGAMVSYGRYYLRTAPHIVTFPGLTIMLVVLGFNLFGDGLRDALDPRLKVD